MSKQIDYQKLKSELDEIIATLQSDDGSDIEHTIALHKRGEEIVEILQHYLESAENTITKGKLRKTK